MSGMVLSLLGVFAFATIIAYSSFFESSINFGLGYGKALQDPKLITLLGVVPTMIYFVNSVARLRLLFIFTLNFIIFFFNFFFHF
jgi:Na+/alanine symporter